MRRLGLEFDDDEDDYDDAYTYKKWSGVVGLVRLVSSSTRRSRRKNYDDISLYELLVLLRF
ncbi:MAG: hypothetical protein ACFFDT_35640 [Candidatus Hodarchaeota archaeon]